MDKEEEHDDKNAGGCEARPPVIYQIYIKGREGDKEEDEEEKEEKIIGDKEEEDEEEKKVIW